MKNILLLLTGTLVFLFACNGPETKNENNKNDMHKEFTTFIDDLLKEVKPLEIEAGDAYFSASVTGMEDDYNKAAELEIELKKIYADDERFQAIKKIKESGSFEDVILQRQLDVIYKEFLSMQIDEEKLENMVLLGNEIDKKFSVFRSDIDGRELSDNDIENILKTSANSDEVKAAWLACKELGPVVSDDIVKLVKMRNEVAVELGFNNYHEMSLSLSDQDPKEVNKIFDELDELTSTAFFDLKQEIDAHLAKKFNVPIDELMPWHYQNRFFQEAPKIYNVDLDKYYADQDLVKLTVDYFKGIGLPVEDIVENSDLFEKEGKNQHAYCFDINRDGDVRVLCNVKPNYMWMNTMLHEFGHGVYDKFNDRDLAYFLRTPAHAFTTEAIAMLFGRFASNPQWMQDMMGISDDEKNKIAEDAFKMLRLEQLVFSRWSQVMYRFEKALYENPDQDLNALWWEIVEKYQLMKKPEGRDMPDWATKMHIASAPCYYHNYLLGELLASQIYYKIVRDVVGSDDYKFQSFANNTEVGVYLKANIFEPGNKWYWNEMIENATGEKLTAKYYVMQFVTENKRTL